MNYTMNSAHVKLIRFRESGKYYDTWELDMGGFWDEISPHEAVLKAMRKEKVPFIKGERSFVFVEEPYHAASYPVVLFNPGH